MRAAGSPKPPGRFAALGNRHFRLLFVGGLFTFLTMQVAGIARAWPAFGPGRRSNSRAATPASAA